jgi:hypothetical protein
VRQDFKDIIDIEDGFTFRDRYRRDHGTHARVFEFQGGGHLGVRAVAGLYGDDVAEDAFTGKDEIADEVERFVAGEFVREAQGLL